MAGLAVIAFDRPGFGHSDRPRSTIWTPEAQADLIAAALKEIGVPRAIVLGHSWGTLVALALAVKYPQEVQALVLASGYYYPNARADVVILSSPAIPLIGDVSHVVSTSNWKAFPWRSFSGASAWTTWLIM
jgi:pimeloyl-ACP methyl ester carboxylesterase